jgi:nucleotide-binding universal stress UspA family protein
MDTSDRRPVMAATDFSHDGNAAVAYAADRAAGLGRGLLILHVVPVLNPVGPTTLPGPTIRHLLRRARGGVAGLAEAVTRDHPGLAVTTSVAAGDPVDILLDRSPGAFALVIGARGHGGHPALRWGSESNRVVSRAHCPVFVVRADGSGRAPVAAGPVVVCAGTSAAQPATDLAMALLDRGPSYLVTVHPDGHAADLGCGAIPPGRLILRVEAAAADLAAATARVAADHGAALVVVARDRHAWPFRFGVGSLVHDLVDLADCPVAIVDSTRHTGPATTTRTSVTATA